MRCVRAKIALMAAIIMIIPPFLQEASAAQRQRITRSAAITLIIACRNAKEEDRFEFTTLDGNNVCCIESADGYVCVSCEGDDEGDEECYQYVSSLREGRFFNVPEFRDIAGWPHC